MGKFIKVATREASLKRKIRLHLKTLGFEKDAEGLLRPPATTKETYRQVHSVQRAEKLKSSQDFLRDRSPELLKHIASGCEIDPNKISPRLQLVYADSFENELFRFATLSWSIPVSQGYGRRIRFLVWDENNAKLIGVFALGDPVYNLRVRDSLIGWTHKQRSDGLVGMLDAYVLGAVSPYNSLLCGKMVACLIRSSDVVDAFRQKYGSTIGIISQKQKNANLVAVSTTSALGRSSIYNRLKLSGTQYFRSIGFTEGWGHFHFPERIFLDLRDYLEARKDPYAGNFRFGHGPNWRMRVIRRGLDLIGLDSQLIKHGFVREVFFSELAQNAVAVLKGESTEPVYKDLLKVSEVAELAKDRWILQRAKTRPEFVYFEKEQFLQEQIAAQIRRKADA